jgi:hypothetical protein
MMMSRCAMALAAAALVATASASCLIVRDEHNSAQDLKIEPWGENAVRVRAVPSGGAFRDDLVSALVPPTDGFVAAAAECSTLSLSTGQTVTSGNIQASVGADGLLTFTRISDKKVLLAEATPRSFAPTTTVPSRPGFFAFNMSFHATESERIYGLGQHKTGLLDNAGGKFELAPKNTEILIPVAHSSLGYAFLMNLPSFGSVEFGKPSSAPAPCPGGGAKKCPDHPKKTFCPAVADPHQCSTTGLTTWQLSTVIQADFWIATTAAPPAALEQEEEGAIATDEVSPWYAYTPIYTHSVAAGAAASADTAAAAAAAAAAVDLRERVD